MWKMAGQGTQVARLREDFVEARHLAGLDGRPPDAGFACEKGRDRPFALDRKSVV